VAILKKSLQAVLCGVLGLTVFFRGAGGAEAPTEYQVKAVFVYNFSRFVEWPPQSFTAPDEPFVIGVLGSDPPRSITATRSPFPTWTPLRNAGS
jgi:hypothetical protein